MRTSEVAKMLGVNSQHVAYLCKTGRIKAIRVPEDEGHSVWVMKLSDVEEYIRAAKMQKIGRPPRVKQR